MERQAKACGHEDGPDRISQLPDPILDYILSKGSLNMEDVVRTCVLSKRWRDLWASMPYLAFDYGSSRFLSDSSRKEKDVDFAHFVGTSLLLRDASDVQKFRLRWCRVDEFSEHMLKHLTTWMKYVAMRNVKELVICFSLYDRFLEHADIEKKMFELPPWFFTCPFLEYLNLEVSMSGRVVRLPDVVSLRRLTRLHLVLITIGSISLKAPMPGCPVLEYMELHCCYLRDPDFSSNSLKIMRIHECQISGTRIRIAGPNLEDLYFIYNDLERMEVLLENLPSLAESTIQPGDCENQCSFSDRKPLRLTSPMIETTMDPDLEAFSWFPCPHVKTSITISCHEENDKIKELLIEYFNNKCGCFQE